MKKLIADEKVHLNDTPFTTEWLLGEFDELQVIFLGQMKNDKPDGYVIAITGEGDIYEGLMDQFIVQHGFGRHISLGSSRVGWWENDELNGNAREVDIDGNMTEGWYQMHSIADQYHKDIDEYADFDKYLIKK